MDTLHWILLGIIYLLMAIILYKPFKQISKNGWSEHPFAQSLLWPGVLTVLFIYAVIIGFVTFLTESETDYKNIKK